MVQFRASAGERVWQVGGRLRLDPRCVLLMMLTALAWAVFAPTRAYAADDQIDSFVINYDMQPSGVLKVKETITWRFGSNSGRHGIQRDLVTREPDPDSDQDFVYGISNIQRHQSGSQRGNPVQLQDHGVPGRSRGGAERADRRPRPDHLHADRDLRHLL